AFAHECPIGCHTDTQTNKRLRTRETRVQSGAIGAPNRTRVRGAATVVQSVFTGRASHGRGNVEQTGRHAPPPLRDLRSPHGSLRSATNTEAARPPRPPRPPREPSLRALTAARAGVVAVSRTARHARCAFGGVRTVCRRPVDACRRL